MIPGNPYGPPPQGGHPQQPQYPQQPAMAVPGAGAGYGGPATAPMTPPTPGSAGTYVDTSGGPGPGPQRGRGRRGPGRDRRSSQPMPWWVKPVALPAVVGVAGALWGHRWLLTIAVGVLAITIPWRTHLQFPAHRRPRPLTVAALGVAIVTTGIVVSPPWVNTAQPTLAAIPRAAITAWNNRSTAAADTATPPSSTPPSSTRARKHRKTTTTTEP